MKSTGQRREATIHGVKENIIKFKKKHTRRKHNKDVFMGNRGLLKLAASLQDC